MKAEAADARLLEAQRALVENMANSASLSISEDAVKKVIGFVPRLEKKESIFLIPITPCCRKWIL